MSILDYVVLFCHDPCSVMFSLCLAIMITVVYIPMAIKAAFESGIRPWLETYAL